MLKLSLELIATWSVVMTSPSDIGFDDSCFDLPDLVMHTHIVDVDGDNVFDDGQNVCVCGSGKHT